MAEPTIFVSCGQRTAEERALGKRICSVIEESKAFRPYFAEMQSSLSGLNENIPDALSKAAGFVSVMHGRGRVIFDGSDATFTRASVWVEQEIAIAAYIQRTSKRNLLTTAFIQKGVGREGIRDLLHLNPIEFTNNEEVLAVLGERLATWKQQFRPNSNAQDDRGSLELRFEPTYESGNRIVNLTPILTNNGARAKDYSCTIEVPARLLSFSNAKYLLEVSAARAQYRRFRATEEHKQFRPLQRGDSIEMLKLGISVTEIPASEREQLFRLPIYVLGEIETHGYSLEVPCGELFSLPNSL